MRRPTRTLKLTKPSVAALLRDHAAYASRSADSVGAEAWPQASSANFRIESRVCSESRKPSSVSLDTMGVTVGMSPAVLALALTKTPSVPVSVTPTTLAWRRASPSSRIEQGIALVGDGHRFSLTFSEIGRQCQQCQRW